MVKKRLDLGAIAGFVLIAVLVGFFYSVFGAYQARDFEAESRAREKTLQDGVMVRQKRQEQEDARERDRPAKFAKIEGALEQLQTEGVTLEHIRDYLSDDYQRYCDGQTEVQREINRTLGRTR